MASYSYPAGETQNKRALTEVYLIRHSVKMRAPVEGKSPAFDRMQPFSAEGEDRAKKLLDYPELRGADFAVASTMSRSLATIRYLIEADNVPFSIDDRLREMPNGRRPEHEPFARLMDRIWAEPDFCYPGGESVRACRTRMDAAIREAVRNHPGEKLLIASHGRSIGAYFSGILEDFSEEFVRTINLPDVFHLSFDGEQLVAYSRLEMPFPMPPLPK